MDSLKAKLPLLGIAIAAGVVTLFVMQKYHEYQNPGAVGAVGGAPVAFGAPDAPSIMRECLKDGALEFELADFANAEADPTCLKNSEERAKISGIDPTKTDFEIRCKCVGVNAKKVFEKYKDSTDKCLSFRSLAFVEAACQKLAVK